MACVLLASVLCSWHVELAAVIVCRWQAVAACRVHMQLDACTAPNARTVLAGLLGLELEERWRGNRQPLVIATICSPHPLRASCVRAQRVRRTRRVIARSIAGLCAHSVYRRAGSCMCPRRTSTSTSTGCIIRHASCVGRVGAIAIAAPLLC